jgi:transcriptional regulator with XRE-family HTH domain
MARGWTKVRLARELGLDRTTIENWKKQPQPPQSPTIKNVADTLGIDHAEALQLAGLTIPSGNPSPRRDDDGRRIDAQLDQNEAILAEIDGLLRKASPSHTRAVLELLRALNDEEGRASAG